MSFVDPESEGKPLFHEPTYVDEATRRRRLIPSLILAIPMIVAFVVLTWTQGGMIEWAVSQPRLADGAYHLIVLHMFAHAGLMHLGFNLVAMFALGPAVMERLGPLEPRSIAAFFALFFACGLAGLSLWLAIHPTSEIPMLGASGAIFGLLGFLVRQPDPQGKPIPLASPAMAHAFVEWIKLHLPLVALFAIPLLFGSGFFGLAWEAHLGGFIAGLLLCGPILAWAGNRPDWVPLD
jgi:membrane associated rhomboid family serine protease